LVALCPIHPVRSARVTLFAGPGCVCCATASVAVRWLCANSQALRFWPSTTVIPNPGSPAKNLGRGFARLTAVDTENESVAESIPLKASPRPATRSPASPGKQGAPPPEVQVKCRFRRSPFCLPGAPFAATNRLLDTISCKPLVTDFRGVAALTGGTQFVTLTKLSPDNLVELSAVSSLDCSPGLVF
jgi:hypothetical protein